MGKNNKKGFFKSLLGLFTRGTLGQKYEDALSGKDESANSNPSDSELIVSPARQVFNRFIERKFAIFAVCVVVVMFLTVMIVPLTPLMEKYDDAFTETTQINLPPTLSLRSVPGELKNDIKSIDSYGTFSVGLSNSGQVYIWGVERIGATGFSVELPEEVKNAKIAFVAAGQDHCIAIGEDGKFYGWGSNRFGQYARTEEIEKNHNLEPIPEIVLNGELNPNDIQKVTCGYQASAILMKDHTLYIWGNKNSYANMDTFIERDDIIDIDFTLNNVVGIDERQNSIVTGKKGVYDRLRTSLFSSADSMKTKDFLNGRKIVELRSTLKNVCLLLDDGTIAFAGDVEKDIKDVPQLEQGEKFIDIEGGTYHYTGLTDKGNVYSFGGDHYYQTKVPAKINRNDNAAKIFAGAFQSYAVDSNGELIGSWGLRGYLFGTDDRGANILERVVAGGRITMTVGAIAVIIEIIIGVSIGVISGYFGKWVDILLMRLAEIVSSIPLIPFMIIISALLSQSPMTPTQRLYMMMLVIGVLGWPGFAYITRAQILVARESEYVTAAKAMGVKETKIAFKHILPNVLSVILVQISLAFAGSMLTETSLSWLGFGVNYPQPSWGNMLSKASNATTAINFWWQWLFTSAILILTAVCINTIGDTLRDVLDPKSTNDK